jgi:hypothetical protein
MRGIKYPKIRGHFHQIWQHWWKCIYQNAHQNVYQNTDIKMPIKMYIKYTFSSLTVQIYIHSASNIHSHQIYIYIYIYQNVHQYTPIYIHLQWQPKCTSNTINYLLHWSQRGSNDFIRRRIIDRTASVIMGRTLR